jgi:hypothetical protein
VAHNEHRTLNAESNLDVRYSVFDVRGFLALTRSTINPEGFRSISEGNIDVTGGLDHFAIGRDEAETIDRVGNRDAAHLIVLITDHRAEMTFIRQLDGLNPETRGQNSIQHRRRTAALKMTEDATARFLAGAPGDFPRHDIRDPA